MQKKYKLTENDRNKWTDLLQKSSNNYQQEQYKYMDENSQVKIIQIFELNSYTDDSLVF